MPSYQDVVSSPRFRDDLADLNHAIADGLNQAGQPVAINGNVCYVHMLEDFHKRDMSPAMEPKRRALHKLAQNANCFTEVGVAGGHAALLALHSNPSLTYVGIDLGQRLRPSWPPVDIYVPIVYRWLENRFPGRVKLYMCQAVEGLQRAVAERPFGPIDLLHLDAQKNTRIQEVEAAWPGIDGRCYLLQGDNKNGHVQASSAQLIAERRARPVEPSMLEGMHSANYDLLEIGPEIAKAGTDLESVARGHVLVCVCHQDDETLFCGSLLAQLKGRTKVTVVSFFRPAAKRPDTETREAAMQRVCDKLGAECLHLPFAAEPDQPRLRRFIRMPSDPSEGPPEIVRPLHRHPLFNLLSGSAYALMRKLRPSTIVTHNSVGEYGHIEHVMLHHAVARAAARYREGRLLTFGLNMPSPDLIVPCLQQEKDSLFDEYMPQWNGRRMYDFALHDEPFVTVELPAEEA